MDSLTRTTLQFETTVSENAFDKTIAKLHRVPGVLFTETSVGVRRALVAHDGGVAVASLVAAATGAGASVKVVITAFAAGSQPSSAWYRDGAWISYAALVMSATCLVLFILRVLSPSQLQWIAPFFLLMMLFQMALRRRP